MTLFSFNRPVYQTKPQLTDDQIKQRAAAMRERMGTKCCTHRNSTFKFSQTPTVLTKDLLF